MWMEARTNFMQEKKAEQKLEFGMQIVNLGRQQTVGNSGRQAVPANGIYLDFSQEGMQNLTNRDGMLAQLVQRLEHVEKQKPPVDVGVSLLAGVHDAEKSFVGIAGLI